MWIHTHPLWLITAKYLCVNTSVSLDMCVSSQRFQVPQPGLRVQTITNCCEVNTDKQTYTYRNVQRHHADCCCWEEEGGWSNQRERWARNTEGGLRGGQTAGLFMPDEQIIHTVTAPLFCLHLWQILHRCSQSPLVRQSLVTVIVFQSKSSWVVFSWIRPHFFTVTAGSVMENLWLSVVCSFFAACPVHESAFCGYCLVNLECWLCKELKNFHFRAPMFWRCVVQRCRRSRGFLIFLNILTEQQIGEMAVSAFITTQTELQKRVQG